MHEIQPTLVDYREICAEAKAPPSAMVVFGGTGDLAQRKLIGSLFSLYEKGLITQNFFILGCGRKELTDIDFRETVRRTILDTHHDAKSERLAEFLERIYFQAGQYDDVQNYREIAKRLDELSKKHEVCGCFVFYLAVPPTLFETIVEMLGRSGLAYTGVTDACKMSRVVIEKPFGRDVESSAGLNEKIRKYFDENQIYRIDHYLGKETVQNILMFRFANSIFEPIWSRNYIDHVQITIAESLGIGGRAGYYDRSGCLRDMFQNHMMQLLCLVGMESPASFDADAIRDEKIKLLRSIRPIDQSDVNEFFIRGQYAAGKIGDDAVCPYLEEESVDVDSKTETYVGCKVLVDNWRWKGVPFYMRSGKRLKRKLSEIAITFKEVPHSLFATYGIGSLPANVLVMRIQPEEGISLSFQAKRPGSKACISTLEMQFDYQKVFAMEAPEAYQRLLLDCLLGDQTLFSRYDFVCQSWKLLSPVLESWQSSNEKPYSYPAGASSFKEANRLLQKDDRQWREI